MTLYLLSVLASLDLPFLASAALDTPLVVYGTGAFPQILGDQLPALGYAAVRMVDQALADRAAATGAVRFYENGADTGSRTL